MRIDDAPGEFGWMVGRMQFDVTNRECPPPPKENPGGTSSPVPTYSILFELVRQPDGTYAGQFFTDGMIDEDDYGRGVCRWALTNLQVQMRATGAEGETLFISNFVGDEIEGGQTEKSFYYWSRRYPRSRIDNYPASGSPSPEDFGADVRNQLFKITLAIEGAKS
ncbi:hypothetical protein [Luteimonas huabeiensis]|uniref:hypothetical protein n=1 Tax=Luteimonas huabeiensis TaxID=1244513 RepID=UPI0004B584BA|nr:hypothetical protein [Luteimonas huabeiensis]